MRKNSMFAQGEQQILEHTKDAALYVLGRLNETQEKSMNEDISMDSTSEVRSATRIRVLGARTQRNDYVPHQENDVSFHDSANNSVGNSLEGVSHISSVSGVSFVLVVAAVLALIILVAVVTIGILHLVEQF